MKDFFITLTLLITSGVFVFAQNQDNENMGITVMTYNIRYDNAGDGINRWDNRKEHVTNLIQKYDPDIIGIQEALKSQLDYIHNKTGKYTWLGVGRDDGIEKGEFSPIFFNSKKMELVDWGTFWLSDTPSEPSTGWDAALPRVCTWARLELKSEQRSILVLNTHFDHRGVEARKNSSNLIIHKIQELQDSRDNVILTGDFNQTTDTEGYAAIVNNLNDCFSQSKSTAEGPVGTFSGFDVKGEIGDRIDYIFTDKSIICKNYYTLIDQNQGYYPSDHLPVVAKLEIK